MKRGTACSLAEGGLIRVWPWRSRVWQFLQGIGVDARDPRVTEGLRWDDLLEQDLHKGSWGHGGGGGSIADSLLDQVLA